MAAHVAEEEAVAHGDKPAAGWVGGAGNAAVPGAGGRGLEFEGTHSAAVWIWL